MTIEELASDRGLKVALTRKRDEAEMLHLQKSYL